MRVLKKFTASTVLLTALATGTTAWAQDDAFAEGGEASAAAAAVDNETPGETTSSKSSGGKLQIERPLLLTRHTMELGLDGQIALNPQVRILKGDVDNKTAGGGVFTFSPQLGYFVIDKLELLFNFGLSVPFGESNGGDDVTLGFDLGARYFIDFNVVALYLGGMVGPSWAIPDNPTAPVADFFTINLMVGVLVPINRHIGIDLGMRMVTRIRVDNDFPDGWERTRIYFPIGYLGFSGFFNFITGG